MDLKDIYQDWIGMKYIRIEVERNISGLKWNEIYQDWIGMKYIRIGLEWNISGLDWEEIFSIELDFNMFKLDYYEIYYQHFIGKKTFWVWQDFYISEFGLERHILDWIEKFMSALVGKEYV